MSFIFGGDTGRSYEEIKRDQAVAQAMLEQSMAPAKTIGGGLAALGNAWGGRMLADKSDKRMSEGRKRASEMFEKVLRSNRATTPSETSAPVAPSSDVQTMPLAAPLPGQDVIEAIIQQESAGNPSAVSPKGAGGLMQIMPATARDPGYGVPNIYDLSAQMGGSTPPPPEAGDDAMTQWLADPANAEINKAFGTQYFNAMESQYGGDREKALAAYNAGPGAVDQYGGVPSFDETQAYVKAITGDLGGAQSAPPASGPMESPAAISPELLSLLSDPYLDDGQRSVVQALLQQQIAANAPPETMSPYQQAQIDLQNRRLQAQLDGRIGSGINVNVGTGGENRPVAETDGEVATDKAYAKDFVAWENGGQADALKNLSQLQDVLGVVETEDVSGPVIGATPDALLSIFAPEALDAREQVAEIVQRNLRAILGGQFAQKEGDALISRAFNPRLKPEQNAKRLRRLFSQMQIAYEQKNSAAEYFRANGTMKGFKGRQPNMNDFNVFGDDTSKDDDDVSDLLEKYGE